jgi:hypothetical protein
MDTHEEFAMSKFASQSDRAAAMLARIAELEADAARYRWLRRNHGSYGKRHGIVVSNYNGVMGEYKEISDIDAAIDAARKE